MALGGTSDVKLTAPSSSIEIRRKVGGVHHLYPPLRRTAQDLRTAASDAFHVKPRDPAVWIIAILDWMADGLYVGWADGGWCLGTAL
jgi:hypothetical protein